MKKRQKSGLFFRVRVVVGGFFFVVCVFLVFFFQNKNMEKTNGWRGFSFFFKQRMRFRKCSKRTCVPFYCKCPRKFQVQKHPTLASQSKHKRCEQSVGTPPPNKRVHDAESPLLQPCSDRINQKKRMETTNHWTFCCRSGFRNTKKVELVKPKQQKERDANMSSSSPKVSSFLIVKVMEFPRPFPKDFGWPSVKNQRPISCFCHKLCMRSEAF